MESSLRLEKLGEGNDAKLTRGFGRRCGDGGRLAAEKQIGGDFPSQTRSLEPRETMRNAAQGCGEGGGGVQCLLYGHSGEVRGQGGRAAAVGECGFNGFHYEVEKEGEEGESVGRCLMRGNRGGTDGASLPIPWSTGGRPMVARSVAAPARLKAAQATEVGEDPWLSQSGLHRPIGQLGRCKVFGPGEEGWCSGLSWAKKAGWPVCYGGLRDEKSEKRKGNGRAAKATGQKLRWATMKNRKRFSDFD
jgi:hypothetical protein